MTSYDIAKTYSGLHDYEGAAFEPKIVTMLQLIDPSETNDDTPWCSAFVNYVANLSNAQLSRRLEARSWLNVGTPIDLTEATQGYDVVILKRPTKTAPDTSTHPGAEDTTYPGHVGFYHHHDNTRIWLLGGNQDDMVKVKAYPLERLLGIRRIKKTNNEFDEKLLNI